MNWNFNRDTSASWDLAACPTWSTYREAFKEWSTIYVFRAQDEGIGLESGQTGWFLEQRWNEPAFS